MISASPEIIIILNEFREYSFTDIGDKDVVIYPAFCQSKHSVENNLGWIKNAEIETRENINIGIAHGALKGITPDMKEEYFLMSEEELKKIPVDAWLIGHTHIAYPGDLDETKETAGYKIFNAGTHEQTDLHNNSEGDCFIIRIEKNDSTPSASITALVSIRVLASQLAFRSFVMSTRSHWNDVFADLIVNLLE